MSLIIENYYKRVNTFIRFILVGLINTCIGLSLILILLNVLELSYWISTFIGNSIGATCSYILNKNFTFNSKVSNQKGITLFILVILGSYFISYSIGYVLFDKSKLLTSFEYVRETSLILAAVLYTVLNYLGQRYIAFK
ncbi:putative flippase GtrA [Metabacillus crassostreae]|uniref:GtrA family protein n=1 Tax=Metabacillus crassostreae TaxID=929098 RepID=UPI001EF75BDD|nr:GtrA family protein [Metabacillus crassostreae]MBM7606760.1 putative flippase GtrA [Metabacillus crassostreae]